MKRKLPEYVIKAREANAQAERNAAMGFIMFVIGVISNALAWLGFGSVEAGGREQDRCE